MLLVKEDTYYVPLNGTYKSFVSIFSGLQSVR